MIWGNRSTQGQAHKGADRDRGNTSKQGQGDTGQTGTGDTGADIQGHGDTLADRDRGYSGRQ